MQHIMGIFMFVKVQPVLFFQRIFYRVADKQQGKMKMLFFVVTASCIGSQKICLHTKGNGNLRSIEMKFFIKFRIKAADLGCKYGNFFLQSLCKCLVDHYLQLLISIFIQYYYRITDILWIICCR